MKRIVLTGGPGAGKTVISTRVARDHAERFVAVPEAATQIYDQLQTRWDRLDLPGRREVQRRIYALQIEQEAILLRRFPDRILLLDRGTIDGAAYWPEGPEDYWRDLGSDLAKELGRYDAVIWLQTSAALGLYDGDSSNPCRFEHPQAAIDSGHLLRKLWAGHPKLVLIDALPTVEQKLDRVLETLDEIVG